MTAAQGPSHALDAVPYLRRSDFPRCPRCNVADDVMSAGQWADGLCWWNCCHCEHDWKTVNVAQGPSTHVVDEGTSLATPFGPATAGKFWGFEDTNQIVTYPDGTTGAFHWNSVRLWSEAFAKDRSGGAA